MKMKIICRVNGMTLYLTEDGRFYLETMPQIDPNHMGMNLPRPSGRFFTRDEIDEVIAWLKEYLVLLTPEEAADLLTESVATVYRRIERGELEPVSGSRHHKVLAAAVVELIAGKAPGSGGPSL